MYVCVSMDVCSQRCALVPLQVLRVHWRFLKSVYKYPENCIYAFLYLHIHIHTKIQAFASARMLLIGEF